MDTWAGRLGSGTIALSTALAIVALVLPLFLNPIWVAFEQGRAQAAAWTGFSEPDLRFATNEILADLVLGPPDFDVSVDETAVLNEREREHMRDVRGVFVGFFAAAAALAIVGILIARRRLARTDAASVWRDTRSGAASLIVALVVGGIVALVAFDALFEVFHRLFFAGGSYSFDPRTERLVQLFPFQFWQETAIAVGVVSIVVAGIVAIVATRAMRGGTDPGSGG